MDSVAQILTNDQLSSTLNWWRDAGVDVLIDETPRNWIAQSVAAPRLSKPAAEAVPERPNSLGSLVEWLMTSTDVPEGGPAKRRVAPTGDPASDLMVLSDLPDIADVDSAQLLSGEIAPLFDNMLAALGCDRSSIYLASLCPGRPPSGRLSDASRAALADAARAHIGFIAPKRLWLLGASASRAVLGISDVAAHGKLHSVNLDGVMIDAVATAHPRLLDTKEKKARAWSDMQRLMKRDDL